MEGNERNLQLQNQIPYQDEQGVYEYQNIYKTWDNIHLYEKPDVNEKTFQDKNLKKQ